MAADLDAERRMAANGIRFRLAEMTAEIDDPGLIYEIPEPDVPETREEFDGVSFYDFLECMYNIY